jgi:hypothetical protein
MTDVSLALPQQAIPSTDEIPDFTGRLEPIRFKVHGRIFEATPAIPTRVAFRLMDLGKGFGSAELSTDQQFDRLAEFFQSTLIGESATTFVAWMDSTETPVGLVEAIKLMEWLMGEWGLSPTKLSSTLVTPLVETGPSSPAGALPME